MPAPTALPAFLSALVGQTYARALASGVLIFTASAATAVVTIRDVPFRLRFCPSLQRKPQALPPASHPQPKPKLNPFLPPHPELLVAALEGYNIILNRFPVVPRHFLLCTAEFQEQILPLRDEDVRMMYQTLCSWDEDQERLFAFFNCGRESGASQPHRHVQFLPVAKDTKLLFDDAEDGLHPRLPFRAFRMTIADAEDAVKAYRSLLGRVEGAAYNLATTKEWMAIAPRVSEDGGCEGVGINAAVLGGEVLVKRPEEWEKFTDGENGGHVLEQLLSRIGVENDGEAKL